MKSCDTCGQILAQKITTCPACGSQLVAGIKRVDDYEILNTLHEGRSSLVFRVLKKGHKKPVTLRLFTSQSGVDKPIAQRLEKELQLLSNLPEDLFVQHFAIHQSKSGLWYRISEWVDADNWGSIFVSGILNDQRRMVTLFYNIASALDTLHKHDHFMPYLILDDILLPRDRTRSLAVKINYKLSRFLNARATHHGPMLDKLLTHHPDILNKRAIDFRSGIWSLGKIFVELLTADHNQTRFSSRVDTIQGLDPELAVLIKIMLSDDPDLRPQSMAKVAETLEKIRDRLPSTPLFKTDYDPRSGLIKEIARFKRLALFLLALISIILGINLFVFLDRPPPEPQGEPLAQFIESHIPSIGFLVVEYWLKSENEVIYQNKVEGTAFLVDFQGHLLTNRHVACPWLEDTSLFRIHMKTKDAEFGRRMFLWFEGAKAFKRLKGIEGRPDLEDSYYFAEAYQSEGKANLRVVGVPRETQGSGNRIYSQFKHDFAVLKIDTPPLNILPLPLETELAPDEIKRLSQVIIMGFPLGSRTQDDHINASITRGHVRRTSPNLIQIDSSIYKGNSGGPAVNASGRVIGIASGVVTDKPSSSLPLFTPLSDFGLVLPITEPARFLAGLKSGQMKWNGYLDFSLSKKIDQVVALAIDKGFDKAADLAEDLLKASQDPALIFTSGLLDFCNNELETSREKFIRHLSIEESTSSRLMLLMIDWISGQEKSKSLTRDLFALDWQHPDEFSGYLAGVLADGKEGSPSFRDYENQSELNWRKFIQGVILEKKNRPEKAGAIYKEIILASGANDQLYLMAFARLTVLRKNQLALAKKKNQLRKAYDTFNKKADEQRKISKDSYQASVSLIQAFESPRTNHGEKIKAAQDLMKISPENRTIIGRMAFYHASRGEWEKSLTFINTYFKHPSRETGLSLSLGLLKAQLLSLSGDDRAARAALKNFGQTTHDQWYGILAKALMDKLPPDKTEARLVHLSGKSPTKLITLHTALGLDAEGKKDLERAAHHYREALGTYLDAWNEYDLARARLMAIRQ